MYDPASLIDAVIEGDDVEDVVDQVVEDLNELRQRGTARRPRAQKFKHTSDAVSSVTGKRKDPKRRRIAMRAARKGKAKRKQAARRVARSAAGRRMRSKIASGKVRR